MPLIIRRTLTCTSTFFPYVEPLLALIISDSDDSDMFDEPAMQGAIQASASKLCRLFVHAVLGCLLHDFMMS